ncbi:hypothetical protein M670_00158 [Schinkia azotoformans MEV2011]|uniref:Uncharacterized protein n=1 Tax=Schinkia azotoformans MEV2011 TaxID=1348973 RepID=A0A072NSF4_SCHAZ|nr:hypothetical protein M670_00158 [Schinkia azotoformans MEV2011]
MIYLGDNYRITKNEICWMLQEKKISDPNHQWSKSDKQTENWVTVSYHSRIEHLINHLLNRCLLQSNVNTLEDIKTALKHTENSLKIRVEQVSK